MKSTHFAFFLLSSKNVRIHWGLYDSSARQPWLCIWLNMPSGEKSRHTLPVLAGINDSVKTTTEHELILPKLIQMRERVPQILADSLVGCE